MSKTTTTAKKSKSSKRKSAPRDVYQEVTDSIIASLEKGTGLWERPWLTSGLNKNAASGKDYRGVNQMLLMFRAMEMDFNSNLWVSFKQAKDLGGCVNKGEKGTQIVFWKFNRSDAKDKTGAVIIDPETGNPKQKQSAWCRFYTVFNVEQTSIPAEKLAKLTSTANGAEKLENVDAFIEATGASITHGGDKAFYSPTGDYIKLPEPETFINTESYYATSFHELTHWTGHKSRCDRTFGGRFGDLDYAAEELVAEFGAAFLCAQHGIEGKLQHPQYIKHWLTILKGDNKAIFTAASKAQKATDFLSGTVADEKAEETSEAPQGAASAAAA